MFTAFFSKPSATFLVLSTKPLELSSRGILEYLFGASLVEGIDELKGAFVGPRNEFVSPFSSNAVEIVSRAGLDSVIRIEQFFPTSDSRPSYDVMLENLYSPLNAKEFLPKETDRKVRLVSDIAEFNKEAGLALSDIEVEYLNQESNNLGRAFTDAELYAFSQINSEHCRHKIFNGTFVIDGKAKAKSLFSLIKDTSKASPDFLVSAYKDNVAFVKGPKIDRFTAPVNEVKTDKGALGIDRSSIEFGLSSEDIVLSLKAETHNFPTTVEPFNGASTGSGGEIRDRMAGGKASVPLAGTAVYMTSYPRLDRSNLSRWEKLNEERPWKYQSPAQILIKASNGASDFGNKFGQPLITGSTHTFEMNIGSDSYAYDRVVMLAGGVGYARKEDALKGSAEVGDVLVLLGGDNYRIGMGGGSVSSVDTGALGAALELSAIQRANPEMQKRVANVVRTLSEARRNPIKLIHDHGAGGHINCFSELLEEEGGEIYLDELPLGDRSLSPFEILCNESQERMGLIVSELDYSLVKALSDREGAPCYLVGKITGNKRITVVSSEFKAPFDLPIETLLGSSPETIMEGVSLPLVSGESDFSINSDAEFLSSLKEVLSLEGVACKDWLTNKVDRSVSGLVAQQQCAGPLHLPLNDCGVMALDYSGSSGVATSIGHASAVGLISPRMGAILSVCESLTNLVFAPLTSGVKGIALSANWMWPCKQAGEDARLFEAVEALSAFSQSLGIPVPTGKDSLSMTMHYSDEDGGKSRTVKAPGTVVVSSVSETTSVWNTVSADAKKVEGSILLHLDFTSEFNEANSSNDGASPETNSLKTYPLGGSAFSQTRVTIGSDVLSDICPKYFSKAFAFTQELVKENLVLAGHDISSGGIITAALEMSFVGDIGVILNLGHLPRAEASFSERPGVLLQVKGADALNIKTRAEALGLKVDSIGEFGGEGIRVIASDRRINVPLAELRSAWFKTSYLLDQKQTKPELARERFTNLGKNKLTYQIPSDFKIDTDSIRSRLSRKASERTVSAAIVREKGTNGDRELAYALFAAGFKVYDVTMSDIISGEFDLGSISFLAFPGGFSNSDVLGAGVGWSAAWKFNEKAKEAIESFYARPDTMSLGVCNGCQLMTALGLIDREAPEGIYMNHNDSGKFESTFVSLNISESPSIMLKPLQGMVLGAWVAHGEGRFSLDALKSKFEVAAKYQQVNYPGNPNGSDLQAAAICSSDGRHLAIMPHIERSFLTWQWPYLGNIPNEEKSNFTPWMQSFIEAEKFLSAR